MMKKLLAIVVALSFFIWMIQASEKKESMLDGIVIVLDAGHGGKDQGADCAEGSEAQLNLAIVKKLEKELKQYGAQVVLTRDGDYDLASKDAKKRKNEDLQARMKMIEENEADLFFSIHANSFASTSVQGIQLFYQEDNEVSKQLCEMVHTKLLNVNKNILADKPGDYYVLNESGVPSLLIECGFLSNEHDRRLLFQENYQNSIAKSMSEGILEFFIFFY